MLATCGTCGQPVASTAVFCGSCGLQIRPTCPRCGGPVGAQARWCGTCGSDVVAVSGVAADAMAPMPPVQPTPVQPTAVAPASWPPSSPPPVTAPWQPGAPVPPGLPAMAVAAPRRRGRSVLAALIAVFAVVAITGVVVLRPDVTPSASTPPVADEDAGPQELAMPDGPEGSLPPIEETKPATGHLTVGAATPLVTQTIGAGGGTIAAGGLQIQVPGGTLAADTTFDIKQAPITDSTFGGFVTPITPLYLVDNGDAAFGSPVTVTMQATIPAGATAMAFSYDDATGTITPLTPLAQDATTLTVAATHFSPVFGGLVDLAREPTTVDSGFRPGTDDWQFPNYGSYLSPKGICEGKTVSEVWYYVYQRRGADAHQLYGLSDNNGAATKTPDLWRDDSDGYRMASVVQADPFANAPTYIFDKFFRGAANAGDTSGRSTYEVLRAAIATTGQPQLVSIDTDARDAGHSMVVYQVTPDRIYVADPNYPGRRNNPRWIPYDPATGKLGPYSSGLSSADIAANGARSYTRFRYLPPQARLSDASVAAHWAEFKAGTAGDAVFPTYQIRALVGKWANGTDAWAPLGDGYRTTKKVLTIDIQELTGNISSIIQVYRGTSPTPLGPWAYRQTIDLQEGENPLGIAVYSRKGDTWSYVDFVRLVVNAGVVEASVSPERIDDPTAALTLTVSVAYIPPDVKSFAMVVDWGDGSPVQTVAGRKPDVEGNAQIVVSRDQLANQGRGVTQITVSFAASGGQPPGAGSPLKGWPKVTIPVSQPGAAPGFAAIRMALWMGRCSFCVDFRAATELRLVATSKDAYAGNPEDLAAWGIASLDLTVGDEGRTITSLRIVYADDPNHVLTLTGIPITGTQPDPGDKTILSQFSLRGFQGILKHLTWQLPSGKDQSSWVQDPGSAGQEYLDIYLRQP